jgi:hypothetical protein
MHLLLLLVLAVICHADTNLNYTFDVGGSNPPTTFPVVNGYNSLDGPYKHVVILSIDGLHEVFLDRAQAYWLG